jgi:hypothetical protein
VVPGVGTDAEAARAVRAAAGARQRDPALRNYAIRCWGATQCQNRSTAAVKCPQKAGNRRFLNEHSRVGRGIVKEGAGSVGLWGAGLLTMRPAFIVMGATVFVIGVLTGAGVAAWMMPPV